MGARLFIGRNSDANGVLREETLPSPRVVRSYSRAQVDATYMFLHFFVHLFSGEGKVGRRWRQNGEPRVIPQYQAKKALQATPPAP